MGAFRVNQYSYTTRHTTTTILTHRLNRAQALRPKDVKGPMRLMGKNSQGEKMLEMRSCRQ